MSFCKEEAQNFQTSGNVLDIYPKNKTILLKTGNAVSKLKGPMQYDNIASPRCKKSEYSHKLKNACMT